MKQISKIEGIENLKEMTLKYHRVKPFCCKPFVLLVVVLGVALVCGPAFSGPVPGTTYDQSNYQELEGVALESLENWLREGMLSIKVGEMESPEWKKCSQFLEASARNKGKYDFNENGGLVNAGDGTLVKKIYGYPFPEIDLTDPRAGQKLAENTIATKSAIGSLRVKVSMMNFTDTGLKSAWKVEKSNIYYHQNTQGPFKNPKGFQHQTYTLITDPFEVRGTCVIIHAFIEDQEDASYSYVPQLRRIIRTSSANKSEGTAGSLIAPDDVGAWEGKNTSMTWRYLDTRDILVPVSYTDVRKVREYADGSHEAPPTPLEFGYDKEGHTGVPWAPVNLTWVVRKVHAVEMTPKNKGYNYGKAVLYVDAENYAPLVKEAFDRDMKPFKVVYAYSGIRIGDKTGVDHVGFADGFIAVNTVLNTASVAFQIAPEEPNMLNLPPGKIGPRDFTVQAMVRRSK